MIVPVHSRSRAVPLLRRVARLSKAAAATARDLDVLARSAVPSGSALVIADGDAPGVLGALEALGASLLEAAELHGDEGARADAFALARLSARVLEAGCAPVPSRPSHSKPAARGRSPKK